MKNYKFDGKGEIYLITGKNCLDSVMCEIIKKIGMQSQKKRRSSDKLLSKNSGIANAVVIVCGGVKLGTKSDGYYDKAFSELDNIGEANNVDFVFIRSCGDNPALFNGNAIHTKHVIAIEDYSTITVGKHVVLCVGGGISFDRSWVKKHSPECYFEGERMCNIQEDIDIAEIDMVVSNCEPSFIYSPTKSMISWMNTDKELKAEIREETKIMDMLYVKLNDGKKRVWWHVRTNCGFRECGDITFNSVGINDLKCISTSRIDFNDLSSCFSSHYSSPFSSPFNTHVQEAPRVIVDYVDAIGNGEDNEAVQDVDEQPDLEPVYAVQDIENQVADGNNNQGINAHLNRGVYEQLRAMVNREIGDYNARFGGR